MIVKSDRPASPGDLKEEIVKVDKIMEHIDFFQYTKHN
jgi:hypothetical protein